MLRANEEPVLTVAEGPDTSKAYEAAKKRALAIQGLLGHLFVYALVNTGLFLVNLFTRPLGGDWWFLWPLGIWGAALAIHVTTTFVPVFSPEWAERRARRAVEGRR